MCSAGRGNVCELSISCFTFSTYNMNENFNRCVFHQSPLQNGLVHESRVITIYRFLDMTLTVMDWLCFLFTILKGLHLLFASALNVQHECIQLCSSMLACTDIIICAGMY